MQALLKIYAGKRGMFRAVPLQRRRYEDVGIEYVKDETNLKTYVAVYRDVADRNSRIPPKFFIVYDDQNGGQAIVFVHNYNEDTKSFYVK